jgi:hypothetical protein
MVNVVRCDRKEATVSAILQVLAIGVGVESKARRLDGLGKSRYIDAAGGELHGFGC